MSTEDFNINQNVAFGPTQGYEDRAAEKFNQLTSLNLNDKTESKNGLSYVSWANAWKAFKEIYPTATYKVVKDTRTDMPYFIDPVMGIMVFTEVTADGLTYSMWLPVMDSSNKAMKPEAYTYQVWNKQTRQYENRKVEGANMFDINKAIMRCLVKNLAMFGLALYIYAGEDIPEEYETTTATPAPVKETPKPRKRKAIDRFEGIRQAISSANSKEELTLLYRQHENEVKNNPQILALFTARKEQLMIKTA